MGKFRREWMNASGINGENVKGKKRSGEALSPGPWLNKCRKDSPHCFPFGFPEYLHWRLGGAASSSV